MTPPAVIILAAGKASRFGSCKTLAVASGEPLVARAINAAKSISDDIYLVTGCWHDDISKAAKQHAWPVHLLYAKEWEAGIGSVIAYATKQLEQTYSELMILLADQPDVSGADTNALLAAFHAKGADIACGQYADTLGVPAVFKQTTFDRLKALEGDKGAKALLYEDTFMIARVSLTHASEDIDTPQALTAWENK
ncbi:nucleotidyltransferase family protein [Enterovibrio baiacu]|uniref:nucleotidyltransferase family protein n=1 Tax=Enterovibrio baiacu TaxID=2491023 RepID=UPI001892C7E7|nr:nucleotidyltransferase family protein [Enterovibrio baiacu]